MWVWGCHHEHFGGREVSVHTCQAVGHTHVAVWGYPHEHTHTHTHTCQWEGGGGGRWWHTGGLYVLKSLDRIALCVNGCEVGMKACN